MPIEVFYVIALLAVIGVAFGLVGMYLSKIKALVISDNSLDGNKA